MEFSFRKSFLTVLAVCLSSSEVRSLIRWFGDLRFDSRLGQSEFSYISLWMYQILSSYKMLFKAVCIEESCITPLLEEVAWEAPLYVVNMRCLPVRGLRMVANLVYMKIPDCPSRISVAQRSEHRCVDSQILGSIPGWGSQSFRIYDYELRECFTYGMPRAPVWTLLAYTSLVNSVFLHNLIGFLNSECPVQFTSRAKQDSVPF